LNDESFNKNYYNWRAWKICSKRWSVNAVKFSSNPLACHKKLYVSIIWQ